MSSTRSSEAAQIARRTQQLLKKTTATFQDRPRGPDYGEDRKVPHRNSYDVGDAEAQPWLRHGRKTIGEALAHRDALLQAAEELRHQQWQEHPLAETRALRGERAALAAELEAHLDPQQPPAPIGRPAVIRQELARIDAVLTAADRRLRRIDLTVLKAMLVKMNYATGALFPAYETIAQWAGCSRSAVYGALARLADHGLLSWVRRTIKTANAGTFAPQREQTSNAYYFDHQRRMAVRTWQRFKQLLVAKLKRLGAVPAALVPEAPRAPLAAGAAELRAAVTRLGVAVHNAST